jgi:hypothetical protein
MRVSTRNNLILLGDEQSHVLDPLSQQVLRGALSLGDHVLVDLDPTQNMVFRRFLAPNRPKREDQKAGELDLLARL